MKPYIQLPPIHHLFLQVPVLLHTPLIHSILLFLLVALCRLAMDAQASHPPSLPSPALLLLQHVPITAASCIAIVSFPLPWNRRRLLFLNPP